MFRKLNLFTQQKRKFFVVINQAEVAYREFLGSNKISLSPGLRLCLPLLHQLHRVDMRECRYNIDSINAMKQIANSSNSNTYFIDPNNILPTGKVLSDMNNKTG